MAVSVLYESGNQGNDSMQAEPAAVSEPATLALVGLGLLGLGAAACDRLRVAFQQRHRLSGNRVVRLDYRIPALVFAQPD